MASEKDVKNALEKLTDVEVSIVNLQEEKKSIDAKLKDLKKDKEETRSFIANFMHEQNFSIYTDDSFGEISIRKSPDKYVVRDEEKLMNVLGEHGKVDDFCETTIKINKRLLNTFFKELRSCDSLPECVEIETGEESIVFKPNAAFSTSKKETVEKTASNGDDDFALEEWDSI
jgi:hypothetical protein